MSSAVNLIVATCRVERPQYLFERNGETGKVWSGRQKEAVVAVVVVHVWPKSVDGSSCNVEENHKAERS